MYSRKILKTAYCTCALFLDLKEACDTVDHKIFLRKLSQCGLRGTTDKFLESYLSKRKQFVYANHSKSKTRYVTCGVAQGSTLGPIPFYSYKRPTLHGYVTSRSGWSGLAASIWPIWSGRFGVAIWVWAVSVWTVLVTGRFGLVVSVSRHIGQAMKSCRNLTFSLFDANMLKSSKGFI